MRKAREVHGIEAAERKSLLARGLGPEPFVGNGAQLRHERRHPLDRDDLEGGADLLQVLLRAAEPATGTSLQCEGRQRDDGLFAHLQKRQPQVDVEGEVMGAYFIEHGPGAMHIGCFAEAPGKVASCCLTAERIA